jgi:hypothetical protein
VGLKARVKLFEKLKISIAPAFYVPVIYIPKSVISYEVDSNLKFNMVGKFDIYSAFSFDNKVPFNTASFFSQGGVDVSLGAEYALFPVLDVGTTIRHIPLVPADLKNHLYFSPQFGINGNDIKDWRLSISVPDGDVTSIYDTVSYRVLRPLRFDFYGLFKPLKTDLFVLRPNIGFTVLNQMNLSGKANFNWGIEARLNLKDLFRVSLGTGYEETLWKHRLGLALNLRAFELTLEAGLQSQRFLNSFMLNGATAGVGISFGW